MKIISELCDQDWFEHIVFGTIVTANSSFEQATEGAGGSIDILVRTEFRTSTMTAPCTVVFLTNCDSEDLAAALMLQKSSPGLINETELYTLLRNSLREAACRC